MDETALVFWLEASQLSGRVVELLSGESSSGAKGEDRDCLLWARRAFELVGQATGERRADTDPLHYPLVDLTISVFRVLARERGEEFGRREDMERYLAEARGAIDSLLDGRGVNQRNSAYYLLRAIRARARDVLIRQGLAEG